MPVDPPSTPTLTHASPPGPRAPRRSPVRTPLAWAAAAAVLALAAAAGWFVALREDEPVAGSSSADGSDDRGVQRRLPPLGVFVTTDSDRARAFAERLDVPLSHVVDFSSLGTWPEIAEPGYMLDEWRDTGLRPVYSIAMLPENEEASIEEGATGAYDRWYTRLGESLVEAGQEDAILRIGWEFNLDHSLWTSDDPEAWKQYWRRIATALKAVPGQRFQLDWNVNNGAQGVDAVRYYPGDDVVDIVGVDVYDVANGRGSYPYPDDCDAACRTERQDRAWAQAFAGERGLRFWTLFAAEHGKPVSVPEWGLWAGADAEGGGDNPTFIRHMYEFLSNPRNNVAYSAYFDNDAGGRRHSLVNFPRAAEEFSRLFGGPAAAATTPAATASAGG